MKPDLAPQMPDTQRPPTTPRLLGCWNIDLLILAWVAIVLILVGVFRHKIQESHAILSQHATYAGAYLLMVRLLARIRANLLIATAIRFAAIVALFFVSFLKLGFIAKGINPHSRELELLAADKAIFGTDPLLVLQNLLHPIAVDFFQAAYFSYFVTPIIVFAVLVLRKDIATINTLYIAAMLALVATWLGYIIVPARSPYLAAEDPAIAYAFPYTREVKGFLIGDWLRRTIHSWDTVQYNAFPSGHAAIALVFIIRLLHYPGLRWLVVPGYSALLLSTVYLRYHYVVDVFAGIVVGVFSALLAPRLCDDFLCLSKNPKGEAKT